MLLYVCDIDKNSLQDAVLFCTRCNTAGLCEGCLQSGCLGTERPKKVHRGEEIVACSRCLDELCFDYQCAGPNIRSPVDYYHVCRPPDVQFEQVGLDFGQHFVPTTLSELYMGYQTIALSPTLHIVIERRSVTDWVFQASQLCLAGLMSDAADASPSILRYVLGVDPFVNPPVNVLLASLHDASADTGIDVHRMTSKWAAAAGSSCVRLTRVQADPTPNSMIVLKAAAAARNACLVVVTNTYTQFMATSGVIVVVLGKIPLDGAARHFRPLSPDMVASIFTP